MTDALRQRRKQRQFQKCRLYRLYYPVNGFSWTLQGHTKSPLWEAITGYLLSINSLESHGVFLLRRRIYYPKLWTSYLSSYLQQNMSSSIYDVIMQVKISKICHLYAPSMVFRLNTQHQIHLSRTVLLSASLSPYVIEAVLL